MAGRQTVIRSLHDVGLATWFGGSLFGAVGLNGAAAAVADPHDRTRVAAVGWAKWAPVTAIALTAHAIGGIGLIVGNAGRLATQEGVGANSAVKGVITLAAVGVTAWSGIEGAKLAKGSPAPAQGATEPSAATPDDVAGAQQRLKVLQWSIPVLTGVLLVLSAQQGEQQKPSQVVRGFLRTVVS